MHVALAVGLANSEWYSQTSTQVLTRMNLSKNGSGAGTEDAPTEIEVREGRTILL